MGGAPSSVRHAASAGAVVCEIESDACCSTNELTGRKWDTTLPRPAFVQMSQGEWSAFVETMRHHVSTYQKEGRAIMIVLLGIIVGIAVFHPVLGVVGRSLAFGNRRSLQAYESWPLKEDAPATWSQYGRGCSAGCKYADVFASSGAASSCSVCGAKGCTHYAEMSYAAVLGERAPTCRTACEACWHDPCHAHVKLGGEWFSCCAAWSYETCTKAERDQVAKIKCEEETGGADDCAGRGLGGGRGMNGAGFGLALALFLCFIFGSIGLHLHFTMRMRRFNQEVDRRIDEYLLSVSGARVGATFTLVRSVTQPCKPKGARTYRALHIAPEGALTAPPVCAVELGGPMKFVPAAMVPASPEAPMAAVDQDWVQSVPVVVAHVAPVESQGAPLLYAQAARSERR